MTVPSSRSARTLVRDTVTAPCALEAAWLIEVPYGYDRVDKYL